MGDQHTFQAIEEGFTTLLFGIFRGFPSFVLGVLGDRMHLFTVKCVKRKIIFKSALRKSVCHHFESRVL
jgi:hypothetical protein